MKTKTQLFRIFSDVFQNDTDAINEAIRDSKKAFSYIKQDALYRSNNYVPGRVNEK